MAAAHGLGGMSGALLTGVFAAAAWGGADGLLSGNLGQVGVQVVAVAAVMAYSDGASFALLKAVSLIVPLRVSAREEGTGLDIPLHGEEAYTHGEGALLLLPTAAGSKRVAPQPADERLEVPA